MKPKFIEISEGIIANIKSGELLPGDKIPSENELINNHKISNTTARKVLSQLESEGWARRIKGKGTYVLNREPEHHLLRTLGSLDATRRGFHDYITAEGFSHKDIILEKTILKDGVYTEVNNKHYIIEGPTLKIHQLRYADDELMKDEIKYISLQLCPKIDHLSTEISYFKTYEDVYHLKITDVKQTLSVNIISPSASANNFGNSSDIPLFVLDSVILCGKNQVIEIEKSLYRGDKYKFAIIVNPIYNGKKNKIKNKN